MPDLDAHIHAFQDDRTERASLDRINQAKELWRAYIQSIAEVQLTLNKIAIEQAVFLSKWRAEDRARRPSRVRPIVCVDCGARDLEHFSTSREGGYTLCSGRFQSRVERRVARKAASPHP